MTESKTNNLFTPLEVGKLTFSNRVIMAPMTRGRADEDSVPTDIMGKYYSRRASAGLIITEATGISRQGLLWFRAPGIWSEKQVQEWTKIVKSVHDNGGLIALQLWHMGRAGHSLVSGQPIVSSSAIKLTGQTTALRGQKYPYEVPKVLTTEETSSIVQDYINAALNARKAGFDMVEIHAANGYLIDQFIQSKTNTRNDKYGGSIEGRLLFLKEITLGIIKAGIEPWRIGCRFSPNGTFQEMGSADNNETFTAAIEWLVEQNIGYIHCMIAETMDIAKNGFGGFHGLSEYLSMKMVRDIIDSKNKNKGDDGVITRLIGNVEWKQSNANMSIENGMADGMAFGRPFISNPDLVYRMQNGIELEPTAAYPFWWNWQLQEEGYCDWKTVAEKKEEEDKKEEKKIEMEYRYLGNTGLRVSVLGLGTMTLESADMAKELISTVRDSGVNFFDCAELYGTPRGSAEIYFGQALKRLQMRYPSKYRRSDLVITTKFFFGTGNGNEPNAPGAKYGVNELGLSRKHLMEAINQSLQRLQLDYVDIVYAHRYDPSTSMEEIVRGFTDIINQGKAFYWGTSMWNPERIVEAYWIAKINNLIAPVVEQPMYNMFYRKVMEERYTMLLKPPYSLGTTTWSPLDAGILTGKYINEEEAPKDGRLVNKKGILGSWYGSGNMVRKEKNDKVKQLMAIADKLGVSMVALAIGWVIKHKNVSCCMLGGRKAYQLAANMSAIEAAKKLNKELMDEIDGILDNKPPSLSIASEWLTKDRLENLFTNPL